MPSLFDHRNFPFPLNVYAHILMLEEGEVKHLHYGLFLKPGTSASAAQRYSSQLVLEHLPSLPCRVLEVGIGLASTLVELKQLGYQVTGITPDPAQVQYAKKHFGADMPVICTRLEDFPVTAESFDLMLFQESAQYISPLDIFTKASELLALGGEMLILDEFALNRTEPGKENLHLLEHFITLAGRFGFEVTEQQDLSLMAAPTLDYWLARMEKHRTLLAQSLGLPLSLLDELKLSTQADREKYAAGRYGYALLRLKKITVPRWRLGEITEASHEQMLALFKSCFGHEMSPAHWQWKYAEGRGQAIGVWQDNELIAHYAGTTRDILFFGRKELCLQLCDVMVKQSGRKTLSRKGPFFLAASTFLESHLGFGTKHLLAIGFPNERARALPQKLGLYADEVEHMVEISWKPATCVPKLWTEVRRLSCDNEYSEMIANRIWLLMSQEFNTGLIGVRDWNYLKHRYFNHPDKCYEVFLIRNRVGKAPRGLIVCRQHGGECELLEIIAPLNNIPGIINHARKVAGCAGAVRLYCWVTMHYSKLLLQTGGKMHDLGISVPANLWTPGPPLEQIRNRWWLTGGDTDFR